MDHSSLPACAMYRNTGTVIVRLKMEVETSCCQGEVCPPRTSSCPDVRHRPSQCEQCTRTRLISQYSDCDSDVLDKCRPYRSSSARSRYVNVCAAVCLLLLLGGLSPRSSAAPHRNRASMQRTRRHADEENQLWANPCDYNDSASKPLQPNQKELALKLAMQAKNVFVYTLAYKDNFTSRHSYSSFDELLRNWESEQWLRKFSWLHENAFPKEKTLNQPVPDENVNTVMQNLDDILPSMYKGLKMIVASLYTFHEQGVNPNVLADLDLKNNINKTMHGARAVLCYFTDIMHARNLEILPVLDSELPDFVDDNSMGLVLYRDTLNYLEYLEQVFKKLEETSA